MAALQIQKVYDSFASEKRDIDDVGEPLFLEWVQFVVNFIYNKVKGVDPNRFIVATTPFTVDELNQTEPLPADFQDINQTNCGMFLYDNVNSLPTDEKLGITGYGSSDEGYYLDGLNIVFTGIEGTAKYFVLRYIPQPPVVAAMTNWLTMNLLQTGKPIVEARHLEPFVKSIDVLYEQWDVNPSAESVADFRFVRALDELLSSINRTPQVSSMSSPFNLY